MSCKFGYILVQNLQAQKHQRDINVYNDTQFASDYTY